MPPVFLITVKECMDDLGNQSRTAIAKGVNHKIKNVETVDAFPVLLSQHFRMSVVFLAQTSNIIRKKVVFFFFKFEGTLTPVLVINRCIYIITFLMNFFFV